MKKIMMPAVALLILFCGTRLLFGARQANNIDKEPVSNLTDVSLRTIAVDSRSPNVIYIGSESAVYKSLNGGRSWQETLRIKGAFESVNFIEINPSDSNAVLAATQNGLYRTLDGGERWERIFKGTSELQSDVLSCVYSRQDDVIYAGTRDGLFASADKGRTWNKKDGGISAKKIQYVAVSPFDKNILLAATDGGVFRTEDAAEHWQKVFSAAGNEPEDADIEGLDDIDTQEYIGNEVAVNSIAFDTINKDIVYMGTERGVFITKDGTKAWQRLPSPGLLSRSVKSIIVYKNILCAATPKGAFRYNPDSNKWTVINIKSGEKDIEDISMDEKTGMLWLLTKSQVLTYKINEVYADKKDNASRLSGHFENEPTIKQVQDIAIRYAEVDPEKIASWRKQARIKAMLPTLSGKLNNDITDLYDWEGGSTTTKYDNVLNRGKEALEWEASVSWDLGDLVWSTDQTSIDVRSRLTVQLRNDILDEVNRTYFERRRLQLELLNSPPEDEYALMEKQLRLEELTADLDGLTGGRFSELSKSNQVNI